jgi:hypothetical protein
MDKDRDILPVGPIGRTVRLKPVGAVRLFKRPEYMPKSKQQKKSPLFEQDDEEDGPTEKANHAHSVPEKIGEHIDFKI